MKRIVMALLIILTGGFAVIGHDIEVVWEKDYFVDSTKGSYFGVGLGAGDLNADGHLDIAISFGNYVFAEDKWYGGVYVFLGNPLDTFVDATIWTHEQLSPSPDILVMDINGDGIDDLMAGKHGADRVIGFFGPLEDEQKEDFWMVGEPLPGAGIGKSLANAGDVNGDGWEDLIAGGPDVDDYGVYGGAYIYFGGPDFGAGYIYPPDVILPGGFCHGEHGWCENFGWLVGGGGDFNSDGYDDVIVSAPTYGNQEIYIAGRIYIYFGGDPMDSIEDVTFTGEGAWHELGAGSGIDLLDNGSCAHAVFGAPFAPSGKWDDKGKAYVLFGGQDWDSIPDVEILGRTDSSCLTQGGTSSTGDADHDGRDDFILGAPAELSIVNGELHEGASYFYRGGNVIDNVFDGWLEGEGLDDQPGWELTPAGDFDGDGRSEFLVSNYAIGPGRIGLKVWLCTFTGVGIEESKLDNAGLRLELSATVTRDAVRFYYDKPQNKEASLSIYDVSGALVRRYNNLTESSVEWNLRDSQGKRVPSGVYTARLDAGEGAAAKKLVVLR